MREHFSGMGKMLQDRQKENSFERCPRHERGRSRALRNVPFEEISKIPIREAPALLGEHLRVSVAADVVRDPVRQVRHAAPDVEDAPAPRQVRQRGRNESLSDAPREKTVEGRTGRHAAGFTPSNVRSPGT